MAALSDVDFHNLKQLQSSKGLLVQTANGLQGYVTAGGDPDAVMPALIEEIDALRRFKAYVHARLDAAGIPTHPDGPHSAEGCRVGDRLDMALNALDLLRELHAFEDFEVPIEADEPTSYADPAPVNDTRERIAALIGACSATAQPDGENA
jgi:hypothetical protein